MSVERVQSGENLPLWLYRKCEKTFNRASELISSVDSVFSLTRVSLPHPISNFSLFDLIFAPFRLVTAIKGLFAKGSFSERLFAPIYLASEVSTILFSGVQLIEMLKTMKVVAQSAFGWTNILYKIFLPVQVILAGKSLYDLKKAVGMRREFETILRTPQMSKAESHRLACLFVKKNASELEQSFRLSKKVKLQEKAAELLSHCHGKETEHFLETLSDHMKRRTIFDVASQVLAVASTVLGAVSLFLPVTGALVITTSVVALAAITLSIADRIFIKKNPFSDQLFPQNLNRS